MTITLDLEFLGYGLLTLLGIGLIVGFLVSLVSLLSGGFVTTYKTTGFATTGLCHVVHTTSESGWLESVWEGDPSAVTFYISRQDGKVTYGCDSDSDEYYARSVFHTDIKREFYEALVLKVKEVVEANKMTRVTVEFSFPNSDSKVREVSYVLRDTNWHDAETWYELEDRGADKVLRQKLDTAYGKWVADASFQRSEDETPNSEIDSREED